ncbi:MAG: DUF945 domain-containing protein [Sphingobacterium sp.]|jgi:phage/plasmid-like protein (TIGR03299 family)|uniref:DUF932 domain-containing protein n=1 Tax=Sphingobacterium sp. TaxID=341027 RepID=UPI00283D8CD1|nr:DUF932 domain-containing protein [Sphingobacterium sp.]MDR3008632.1 DUF945 domain-containing protein [Sphingobacterium sp.]
MAHNINFNNETGTHSFFSVKEKAWHGLGQIVENYPTSKEAIIYANLDYEVEKMPLQTVSNQLSIGDDGSVVDFNGIAVPQAFATIRTDNKTPLGVVGKDYHVVQNTDAFAFFDAIVSEEKGVLYETAGALGNGERIFITAKLPDTIRVGNNDDITEQYIFLTTSHDGSGSITAAFTPVRIVCQNTLNAAMTNMSNVVRIKHTANAQSRLKDAHKIMGIAAKNGKEMEALFNHWSTVQIKDSAIRKLIKIALCPNKETLDHIAKGTDHELSTRFKNMVDSAFNYAMTADSQLMDTTKGTLFGAYNAVTGYYQNVHNFNSMEAKLDNIVLGGTVKDRVQKAFDLCLGYDRYGIDMLEFN